MVVAGFRCLNVSALLGARNDRNKVQKRKEKRIARQKWWLS